jgi:DNA gyrase/topoisomerase IV subunit B
MPKKNIIEETYTKLTHHEHILERPDSYVGQTKPEEKDMYVFDQESGKIVMRNIEYVAALFKIFDEILVNARDHYVEFKKCKNIKIDIDKQKGSISVWNDGIGIPVKIHPKHEIYVPELIFGHLLTSSNYRKTSKITGGKNGYGAKCISPNALIPLYSGTIKKAIEISTSDQLIGGDGCARNIKDIINGYGKMYEITQSNGESYQVNDQHVLTLCMPEHKKYFYDDENEAWYTFFWDKQNNEMNMRSMAILEGNKNDTLELLRNKCSNIPDENIFDISIQDYLKLSYDDKSKFVGVHGKCVDWENKQCDIDPYLLGVWLGSETQTCEEINSITLKRFGLSEGNKYIPMDYIVNDRDTRLKILAGIIDSQCISSPRKNDELILESFLNNERLRKDIQFLVRSLGFRCEKTSNEIIIRGNLSDIPTKKILITDTKDFDYSPGRITINDIVTGEYVGFEIDSDQRFVLNDFTVTHNCANIYSEMFIIHTVGEDENGGCSEYKQVFRRNMYDIEKPVITQLKGKKKNFTHITFIPDYKRFELEELTDDMYDLFVKRCYDLAACIGNDVRVALNGEEIKFNSFGDYIGFYYDDIPKNLVYRNINSRWEVGVVFDPNCGDEQISFVNGINTYKGGNHVDHIVNQVTKKVATYIKSLAKHKNAKILPAFVKQFLTFYINCCIEDPGFDSQTKEFMNSKMKDWCVCDQKDGGKRCEDYKCDIEDDFIIELCKTGLLDEVVAMSSYKAERDLSRTDGKKVESVNGIEKLIDAKWAGKGKNAAKASLILTEGDSALAFAIAGISRKDVGCEEYGAYPLKGKELNVRKATATQLKKNKEFLELKRILGLKQGVEYKDVSKLRY